MTRLEYIRQLKKERGMDEVLTRKKAINNHFVKIGIGCNIQDGVILGLDGFGYEKNEKGEYEKFPHYGKVILGRNVDIYAPTVVSRGSVRDTVIGNGTKIAGNCQIGHNSVIGDNCLIGPFTCVGGSAVLGSNVRIGQYVFIAHGVKIGNNVDISSFTYVSKDIDDDSKVRGIPAEVQS